MIVKRNKEFSFMDVEFLLGNPQLMKNMIKYHRKKISGKVEKDFPALRGQDDILKYFTWLSESVKDKPNTITTDRGVVMIIYSYEGMKDQDNGKIPLAVQKSKSKRFVLTKTNSGGSNDFIVSYDPINENYVITQESERFMYIARSINYLFGDHGPKYVGTFNTFRDAFNYVNKNVVI